MKTHLSDDDLIRRLYGLDDAGGADHLKACLDCLRRWEAVRERRDEVVAQVQRQMDEHRRNRKKRHNRQAQHEDRGAA